MKRDSNFYDMFDTILDHVDDKLDNHKEVMKVFASLGRHHVDLIGVSVYF